MDAQIYLDTRNQELKIYNRLCDQKAISARIATTKEEKIEVTEANTLIYHRKLQQRKRRRII